MKQDTKLARESIGHFAVSVAQFCVVKDWPSAPSDVANVFTTTCWAGIEVGGLDLPCRNIPQPSLLSSTFLPLPRVLALALVINFEKGAPISAAPTAQLESVRTIPDSESRSERRKPECMPE